MRTTKKNVSAILLLTAAAAMTACSSTPKFNATLDEAKSNYAAAQANPNVIKYSPIELKDAGDAIQRAEGALKEREKPERVEHLSYLAKQKVAVAQELAQLKVAEDSVKNSTAERDKTLLQARTVEADRLRQELNAKQTDRGMIVTLGDVLFDTGKSQLKSGGMRTVQKLAEFLAQNPQRKVSIEGFTDSVGGEDYNQTLSERRADAVKTALFDQGVSSDRVVSRGYGKAFPVAGNETAAGRQLNRRVEIVIGDENKDITPR